MATVTWKQATAGIWSYAASRLIGQIPGFDNAARTASCAAAADSSTIAVPRAALSGTASGKLPLSAFAPLPHTTSPAFGVALDASITTVDTWDQVNFDPWDWIPQMQTAGVSHDCYLPI
jgi:hypothetical protein